MAPFSALRNLLQYLRETVFPARAQPLPPARLKPGRPDIPPGSAKRHATPPDAAAPQARAPENPPKRHRKEINQFPPAKVYGQGRHEVKTRHEDGPPAARGKGPERGGKNK
jgi:hypothetical protein